MPVTFIGGGGGTSPLLHGIIQELGLTSSLNFVLDAADLSSYDGSSQTWTDATGNGNNFFRGTTSGSEATDPTFNGTAGVANEATYFSFDGGDYFQETATHSFCSDWHKNNGAFSIVAVGYPKTAAADHPLLATLDNGTTVDGFSLFTSTANFFLAHSTTNTGVEGIVSGLTVVADQWTLFGASFSESALSCDFRLNAGTATQTVAASTSTDARGSPMRIGASPTPGDQMTTGWRVAALAGWSTAIGATALSDIYTRLKARRFTSLP